MKKVTKMTYIFVLITIVVVTVYDVYAMLAGGTESSISWIMIDWAYRYPLFPLITGIIMGHLFWRMPGGDNKLGKDGH